MKATTHAARHLLALPSWKQEELERQANDPFYVHAIDFQQRWRRQQERNHARIIQEQG